MVRNFKSREYPGRDISLHSHRLAEGGDMASPLDAREPGPVALEETGEAQTLQAPELHAGDWSYLQDGTFGPMAAVIGVFGLAIIVFEQQLAALLHLSSPGVWLSVLGLCLMVTSVGSYLLGRYHLRAADWALVSGTAATTLMAAAWWPDRGFLFFLPGALALAIFRMGAWHALWVLTLLGAALESPWLSPRLFWRSGQAPVLVGALGLLWLIGWIDWHRRSELLHFFARAYQYAQDQLRTVREHRMVLNQTNDELLHAYGEIHRLNKLLQASRLEAEAARRSKEDFVANVSHELRTPLNMIIGFTEMIMNSPSTYGPNLPRALLSDIRVIYRNSQHLSQMINDVLDLARVEAGQLILSRNWVDVRTIVQEAAQAVQPLFISKGLFLRLELPTQELTAFCDRLRIRQILLNLLSNAGRYTDTGGVTVTLQSRENHLVCCVADTGPGIPPQDREHLFEPFHQPHNVDRAVAGSSGLGLSICKKLVELHGGKIWVEDREGPGAAIAFSLPLKLPDSGPPPAVGWLNPYRTAELRQHAPLPKLPGLRDRYVILEQEEMLRRHFAALLPEAEVIRVESLDQLQAQIAELHPTALVINDIDAMEDKRYSHRFQSLPERMPIVSCYVPGRKEAMEKLNVVEYLVKPIVRQELLAIIQDIVGPGSTILIVENELEMALLIRRQLENADRGYRIIQVGDGREALTCMRERRPDLILLDLALPDQDGYQVLREKNLDPTIQGIPVVVISARDPVGEPVMVGRLRVELVGGLSSRDIVRGVEAISQAFSSVHRSAHPASPTVSSD